LTKNSEKSRVLLVGNVVWESDHVIIEEHRGRASPLYKLQLLCGLKNPALSLKQGRREYVNSLDNQLREIIEPMLSLSSEEFSSLLLQLSQLSREELLARFNSEN
ncbi:MAG: hypothetical protein WBA93_08015, partial [Microcoleaceae cyanobacterium]